jgi:hypothetical protein
MNAQPSRGRARVPSDKVKANGWLLFHFFNIVHLFTNFVFSGRGRGQTANEGHHRGEVSLAQGETGQEPSQGC